MSLSSKRLACPLWFFSNDRQLILEAEVGCTPFGLCFVYSVGTHFFFRSPKKNPPLFYDNNLSDSEPPICLLFPLLSA